MYRITVHNRVKKSAAKMPAMEQARLRMLILKLANEGPVQKSFPNFSDLGQGKYHCHLSYKWVACWKWEKGTIEIEVYYAGSREKAPY